MAREFSRGQRVADFLRRELGAMIHSELGDPRLKFVSVTDVEVSRDLAHARVFVTVLGKDTLADAQESLDALNGAAGYLRKQLSRVHSMRTTPALRFFFDDSVTRGSQLSRLIDDAVRSDKRHGDTPDED